MGREAAGGEQDWLEGVCKPDLVTQPNRLGLRSFLWVGRYRPTQATHPRGRGPRNPLIGLAPGGVCRARSSPIPLVTRSPFHRLLPAMPRGRLFSVALSPDASGPSLTATFALWSPDFPLVPRISAAPATAQPPPAQRYSSVGYRRGLGVRVARRGCGGSSGRVALLDSAAAR